MGGTGLGVIRENGAGDGNRTRDLRITSASLCRLSYPGWYCLLAWWCVAKMITVSLRPRRPVADSAIYHQLGTPARSGEEAQRSPQTLPAAIDQISCENCVSATSQFPTPPRRSCDAGDLRVSDVDRRDVDRSMGLSCEKGSDSRGLLARFESISGSHRDKSPFWPTRPSAPCLGSP